MLGVHPQVVNKPKLQNIELQPVEAIKYIEVIIDCKLSGLNQYNRIVGSVSDKLRTFSKIRYLLNRKSAIQLYQSTILPLLDYSDVTYILLPEDKQCKLQSTQYRALRIVFNDSR